MFIDNKNGNLILELNEFDIEKTKIELGDNISIDILILPKKYKEKKNSTIYEVLEKTKKVMYT